MITAQRQSIKYLSSRRVLATVAVLGLAASLGACAGSERPTATGTTAAGTAQSTPASPAPTTPQRPEQTTEAPPSNIPETSPQIPLCTAAMLTGSLDDSNGGAAGHIYMTLTVTNSGRTDCILDGYPGVSLIKSGSTEPIGAPADRDAQAPSNGPITLAPGQGADAALRYTQAGNYQECQRVEADGVLVYPPSATDSLEIAHPLTACENADIKLLSIGAFRL